MAEKKESFFWTSYSDLMTSLFFIMLTLFVLVIVLLHKRMEATEKQLEEIKKVEASTRELGKSKNFAYRAEYKKYVLDVKCFFEATKYRLSDLQADTASLHQAGTEIKEFLDRNEGNQYLLIIEGHYHTIAHKDGNLRVKQLVGNSCRLRILAYASNTLFLIMFLFKLDLLRCHSVGAFKLR